MSRNSNKRNSKKSNSKKSNSKRTNKKSNKKSKNICWKGYHRVKGTVAYSKKSCVKDKK